MCGLVYIQEPLRSSSFTMLPLCTEMVPEQHVTYIHHISAYVCACVIKGAVLLTMLPSTEMKSKRLPGR